MDKAKGLRKVGIGVSAITALSIQSDMDAKIALMITCIAIVGIICQTLLDKGVKPGKIEPCGESS
jgi:hypothetical protein